MTSDDTRSCPVNGCPWRHEPSLPEPMIGESRRAAAKDAAGIDERAVNAHLAQHPVEDFVRTIAELRAELAECRRTD